MYAFFAAIIDNRVTVGIIAQGGNQMDLQAQAGKVFGDIAAYAAQRHAHFAGVGIPHHKARRRKAADIHIRAADYGNPCFAFGHFNTPFDSSL